ncbi:MAG: hypothetical protein QOH62_1513 [Solirubrobacteraceae bacterium]|nr:hypothetical protein [Solirubrobacteraceae bacterium]
MSIKTLMSSGGDPADLRRVAGWALVGGLCVAAAVAIVALLSGSFDDTDWRVVGTSLGFSVFTSTGAAGLALRLRDTTSARALGTTSAAASAIAFVLLVGSLWTDGSEDLWRAFGTVAVLALWSAHASLVLRSARPTDSATIRSMCAVSIATLGIDATVGALAILGALDGTDVESAARVLAALIVIGLLSTALPPLLRRLQSSAQLAVAPAAATAFGAPRSTRNRLEQGVAEVADRLGAMNLPPDARAEVARLRELVRDARP